MCWFQTGRAPKVSEEHVIRSESRQYHNHSIKRTVLAAKKPGQYLGQSSLRLGNRLNGQTDVRQRGSYPFRDQAVCHDRKDYGRVDSDLMQQQHVKQMI